MSASSLLSLFTTVFGWLITRKLDHVVGQIMAAVTIAFEKRATASALRAYRERMDEYVLEMNGGKPADAWAAWRVEAKPTPKEPQR